MSDPDVTEAAPDAPESPAPRGKPCVALMGEFSAGKSTLSNLLIGARSLPVQVTATHIPPVWIAYGDKPPYRVDLDGNVSPIDLNRLSEISVKDTAHVRIFRQSEVLELCDIIDMPGISDPSMGAEVWQRAIHNADMVLWCSHATQAWRQSEAAVWDSLPPKLHETSLLLLTRYDKITTEHDRARLLRRVERETQGLFAGVYPVALLKALEAGDDHAQWVESGAEALTQRLVEILREMAPSEPEEARPSANRPQTDIGARVLSRSLDDLPPDAARVLPQRVSARTASRRTPRPAQSTTSRSLHAR